MGYVRQLETPATEPVSLAQAKLFMREDNASQDSIIQILISAAREYAEAITGRALAQRQFVQVLDSHPYYTDTIQSQLAYPPSYYSLPRYSTTLWNYSQQIKLDRNPVISVEAMDYVGSDGNKHTLNQDTDFILDRISEPARIFPPAGQYWPADLYVPNAVQIKFTAGYDPDPAAVDDHVVSANPPNQQPDSTVHVGVPSMVITLIMMLVAHWYEHREAIQDSGKLTEVPQQLQNLLNAQSVFDFAPTRG